METTADFIQVGRSTPVDMRNFKLDLDVSELETFKMASILIYSCADNKDIGSISLKPRPENRTEMEIGYTMFDEHFRQRHVMSWATRQVVEQGLNEGWLTLLFAEVKPDNIPSLKIMQKLGLKRVPEKAAQREGYLYFEGGVDDMRAACGFGSAASSVPDVRVCASSRGAKPWPVASFAECRI